MQLINNTTLKVLLPSLFYLGLFYIFKLPFNYYPLCFGLIIGIVNWNIHKHKPIVGVLLSVLVSYITYFIAYLSIGVVGYLIKLLFKDIFNLNSDLIGRLSFTISPFIIAPLLAFIAYRYVFHIPKTRTTLLIVLSAVVLLFVRSYFFMDFIGNNILNPYSLWLIIMTLAIQLAIYQGKIGANNKKTLE